MYSAFYNYFAINNSKSNEERTFLSLFNLVFLFFLYLKLDLIYLEFFLRRNFRVSFLQRIDDVYSYIKLVDIKISFSS